MTAAQLEKLEDYKSFIDKKILTYSIGTALSFIVFGILPAGCLPHRNALRAGAGAPSLMEQIGPLGFLLLILLSAIGAAWYIMEKYNYTKVKKDLKQKELIQGTTKLQHIEKRPSLDKTALKVWLGPAPNAITAYYWADEDSFPNLDTGQEISIVASKLSRVIVEIR